MTDRELVEMYGKMAVSIDQIEHCREFAEIISEVRSNLVFACESAKTREDTLAVDGRVTVVGGMSPAAGNRSSVGPPTYHG